MLNNLQDGFNISVCYYLQLSFEKFGFNIVKTGKNKPVLIANFTKSLFILPMWFLKTLYYVILIQ